MSITRRNVLTTTLAGAAALAGRRALAKAPPGDTAPGGGPAKHGLVVPNGSLLPWTLKNGVKVYHLRAEPVRHTIAPGLEIEAWGYNASTPGPVIEATEGDRVRIYVTNKLRESTSIHWHGIFVPYGMDGVAA